MVFITLSPAQQCLAEDALDSNIIHHKHHRRLFLDQLSNLLLLPYQHDQILHGEVHTSTDTDEAAAMPSADAVKLDESIEHLGE